jgi:hypothetical protein
VTCYSCHGRFQHVVCSHCSSENFFKNADLSSSTHVKCYACSQTF